MPVVFTEAGFRFHFYSREGSPLEPVHVHVAERGEGDAKLWLHPEASIAYVHGFDGRTQRWLIAIVNARRTEIEKAGMTISVQATRVEFDEDQMWVFLDDGRTLGVPLAWYPRLVNGMPIDRAKAWISPSGLHWDELDEDISVAGLLAGPGSPDRTAQAAE